MFAEAETEHHCPDRVLPDRWLIDPLEASVVCDSMVVSDVELLRIVLVAIETGARFQRDGISLDPLAWMVTPRRMFDGRPPIEACVDADACSRAVLVHGLGLGLDPEAGAVAMLMADDEFDEAELAA